VNENQNIQWDTNALIQLSEILESDIQKIIITDSYSYGDIKLQPISCKNTLKSIVEGVQSYYNQLKQQDRRGLIYIEGVQYSIENQILLMVILRTLMGHLMKKRL
jgi:hypothetical protein